MLKKEHSTLEGIQKIVNIKASMNKGLSDDLILLRRIFQILFLFKDL